MVLVPDPPHRGEKRLFKSITTDQNGHFVLQGIPPGDYKVFAWENIEHGAYTIPEFLHLTRASANPSTSPKARAIGETRLDPHQRRWPVISALSFLRGKDKPEVKPQKAKVTNPLPSSLWGRWGTATRRGPHVLRVGVRGSALMLASFHAHPAGPVIVQILPLVISHFEPFAPSNVLNRRAFLAIGLIQLEYCTLHPVWPLVINVRTSQFGRRQLAASFVGRGLANRELV